jgi:hypothetical protein
MLKQDEMQKNPNAVALGRLGGRSKSPKKIHAAKRNGRLGGRPKKRKVDDTGIQAD